MGARGPLPTPTPILQARDSRLAAGRAGEVQYERTPPSCPAFLTKEAKAEWRRQVKQLDAQGVLQIVDRAVLAAWCEAWGELVDVRREMAKRAEAGAAPDAMIRLVKIKNAAVERLVRLAQHFGFSPAARARIKAPEKSEAVPSGKARFFNR